MKKIRYFLAAPFFIMFFILSYIAIAVILIGGLIRGAKLSVIIKRFMIIERAIENAFKEASCKSTQSQN